MVQQLNIFRLLHVCSSEINAILVMLAMLCCGLCFVVPNASSWFEVCLFGFMWILAQRALACGGKYVKRSAKGVECGLTKDYEQKPMKGTIILMTGSDRSFGFQAAMELAGPLGATVYLASQSKAHGVQAMGRILAKHPEAQIHLIPVELDLADFSSVQRVVQAFRKQEKVLHVLINNAGVLTKDHTWAQEQKIPSGFIQDVATAVGGDGGAGTSSKSQNTVKYELNTSVNFLGPMLLTQLLMPQLLLGTADAEQKHAELHEAKQKKKLGGNIQDDDGAQPRTIPFTCRVINTTSSTHMLIPFKETATRVKIGGSGTTGAGSGDAAASNGRALPLQRLRYLNDSEGKSPLGFKATDFFKRYGSLAVNGLSQLGVIYSTNEQSKVMRERCGHRCVAMSHHPGLSMTNLFDERLPSFLGSRGVLFPVTKAVSLLIMKTHWEAAQTLLHCATAPPPMAGAGYQHFSGGTTLAANGYVVDCKDYGKGTGVTALSDMAQDGLASEQVVGWAVEQLKPWITTMQDSHLD